MKDYTSMFLRNIIGTESNGKDFETVVGQTMTTYAKEHKSMGITVKDYTGDKLVDKCEGTDFKISLREMHDSVEYIRVDATLDFDNKDNMPFMYDTGIVALEYPDKKNFKIGIRIGNTHNRFTEFNEPVVVIGVDCTPEEYKNNENIIESNLSRNIGKIIGQEVTINGKRCFVSHLLQAYYDFQFIGEDREEISLMGMQTPLQKNKKYRKIRDTKFDKNIAYQETVKGDTDYEF